MPILQHRIETLLTDELKEILSDKFDTLFQESYYEIEERIRLDPELTPDDGSDNIIDITEEGIYIDGSYDYYYTEELIKKIIELVKDEWR